VRGSVLIIRCVRSFAFTFARREHVRTFVVGLFDLNKDINSFKLHLRDFLVQLKEFSEGDNSELYLEEKEKVLISSLPPPQSTHLSSCVCVCVCVCGDACACACGLLLIPNFYCRNWPRPRARRASGSLPFPAWCPSTTQEGEPWTTESDQAAAGKNRPEEEEAAIICVLPTSGLTSAKKFSSCMLVIPKVEKKDLKTIKIKSPDECTDAANAPPLRAG